jgi:hypothetical protein
MSASSSMTRTEMCPSRTSVHCTGTTSGNRDGGGSDGSSSGGVESRRSITSGSPRIAPTADDSFPTDVPPTTSTHDADPDPVPSVGTRVLVTPLRATWHLWVLCCWYGHSGWPMVQVRRTVVAVWLHRNFLCTLNHFFRQFGPPGSLFPPGGDRAATHLCCLHAGRGASGFAGTHALGCRFAPASPLKDLL